MSGANDVPPVPGAVSGVGFAAYDVDARTVFARTTVAGFTPNAAHIHRAPAGSNGPVIVPFQAEGSTGLTWTLERFCRATGRRRAAAV